MKDFWFISMVALLTIAVAAGWPFWLKVAVIANSIVVLLDVAQEVRGLIRGR